MSRVYVSTVGHLVGDSWQLLENLVRRCAVDEVALICGTYSGPVFEFARKHVQGCDYQIERYVDDPDDASHPYCPGFGYYAYHKAAVELQREYPGIVGLTEAALPLGASKGVFPLRMRQESLTEDCVVVHTYTRHDWKNLDGMLEQLNFRLPAYQVGLPGEPRAARYADMRTASYEDQAMKAINAAWVITVASSFACLRSVFGKPQIIASFTGDLSIWPDNPNTIKLVTPSLAELQVVVDREGI
jgi:hypothetical protein